MDHSIFFVVNLDKLSKPTGVVIVDCFSITKSLQETKQYNGISNNVVGATSKASDQPAHMCSLISLR